MRGAGLERAILGLALLGMSLAEPPGVANYNKPVPPARSQRVTDGPFAEVAPMCSPDGRWLAFEYFGAEQSDTPQIRIMRRHADLSSARPLIDVKQYNGDMSWSPDSRWISVQMDFPTAEQNGPRTDDAQIAKINIYSHEVIKLTDLARNADVDSTTSWLRTGWIVFSAIDDTLYAVPDGGGGRLRSLSHLPTSLCSGGMDTLGGSPSGQRIAFDMSDFDKQCDVLWIADVKTGRVTSVPTDVHPVSPFWLDENTILFSGENDNQEPIGIYQVSLRTGRVDRLLIGMYLTPFVCDSGRTLYFSFGSELQRTGKSWNPFYGFHIWKMPMPRMR
jgi:Tol biopolymer transport system component